MRYYYGSKKQDGGYARIWWRQRGKLDQDTLELMIIPLREAGFWKYWLTKYLDFFNILNLYETTFGEL